MIEWDTIEEVLEQARRRLAEIQAEFRFTDGLPDIEELIEAAVAARGLGPREEAGSLTTALLLGELAELRRRAGDGDVKKICAEHRPTVELLRTASGRTSVSVDGYVHGPDDWPYTTVASWPLDERIALPTEEPYARGLQDMRAAYAQSWADGGGKIRSDIDFSTEFVQALAREVTRLCGASWACLAGAEHLGAEAGAALASIREELTAFRRPLTIFGIWDPDDDRPMPRQVYATVCATADGDDVQLTLDATPLLGQVLERYGRQLCRQLCRQHEDSGAPLELLLELAPLDQGVAVEHTGRGRYLARWRGPEAELTASGCGDSYEAALRSATLELLGPVRRQSCRSCVHWQRDAEPVTEAGARPCGLSEDVRHPDSGLHCESYQPDTDPAPPLKGVTRPAPNVVRSEGDGP